MPITNFDKVELLVPMTGANNGTTFTDYSLRRQTVTRVNSPVTSTAQSKFAAYGSSGSIPTDSDYLTVPYNSGFAFGSGAFTIEAWARITTRDTTNGNAVFSIGGTSPNYAVVLRFSTAGRIQLAVTTNGTTATNADATTVADESVWHHVAGVRDGNTLLVFLNGTLESSVAFSSSIWASPTNVRVGSHAPIATGGLQGFINDLCVTKGVAKYTANFTPPARMTQRTLSRASTGVDSHGYDRAVLFDWEAPSASIVKSVTPDSEGDFVASDLIDLEYGVAFIKDGCGPICRGPVEVDPDA